MKQAWDIWFKIFCTFGLLSFIGYALKSLAAARHITPGPYGLLSAGVAVLCVLAAFLVFRLWRVNF
jgi:hypothetical protein